MPFEDTGTRGQTAAQTEVLLQKIFATMPVKLDDLKHKLPHDVVTLEALKGLQEDHPILDTIIRAPSIANFLSMLCEAVLGHRIKWIIDPDTHVITKVRLNYTGRLINKPEPVPTYDSNDDQTNGEGEPDDFDEDEEDGEDEE